MMIAMKMMIANEDEDEAAKDIKKEKKLKALKKIIAIKKNMQELRIRIKKENVNAIKKILIVELKKSLSILDDRKKKYTCNFEC